MIKTVAFFLIRAGMGCGTSFLVPSYWVHMWHLTQTCVCECECECECVCVCVCVCEREREKQFLLPLALSPLTLPICVPCPPTHCRMLDQVRTQLASSGEYNSQWFLQNSAGQPCFSDPFFQRCILTDQLRSKCISILLWSSTCLLRTPSHGGPHAHLLCYLFSKAAITGTLGWEWVTLTIVGFDFVLNRHRVKLHNCSHQPSRTVENKHKLVSCFPYESQPAVTCVRTMLSISVFLSHPSRTGCMI